MVNISLYDSQNKLVIHVCSNLFKSGRHMIIVAFEESTYIDVSTNLTYVQISVCDIGVADSEGEGKQQKTTPGYS